MIDWLLIIISSLRVFTMDVISLLLFKKWMKAERRFLTDIPFLMGMFFLLFGIAKIIDVYIYYTFTLDQARTPEGELFNIGKTRAVFLALESIPMWTLAMLIWAPNKKKIQFSVIAIVSIIYLYLILMMQDYRDLMISVPIIVIPVIIIHIITYIFLYSGRRLPVINSKWLIIGFTWMLINSLLFGLFRTPEPQPWGYVWIHESIELVIVIILGYGFLTPSKYAVIFEKQEKKQ